MSEEKLIPLSRVKPKTKEMDTVAVAKREWDPRARAFHILMEAQRYWDNMSRFRKDRVRNKHYTYGDQWKDLVTVDGRQMTEEKYIMEQGNVPLKNNLIRRLVRNVLGTYRSQSKEPTCTARDRNEQKLGQVMSTILQCNMQVNRMNEVYARSFEDFLISGFIVHRKWFGWRNDRSDCWTDYVNPNNFFMDNNMRDFRGWDVSCVGEIHDVSFETLCGMFANAPEEYARLSEIYHAASDRHNLRECYEEFGYASGQNCDFLMPTDPTRCRVIEVWRKESKPRYRCHDYNSGEVFKVDIEDYDELVAAVNQERIRKGVAVGMAIDDIPLIKAKWFMDEYWYYYYLTPFGDILKEGETPYAHKSHPYVFKAYPYIDGEIHSFVADVIDQQRYVNRLISLYDWIMRASAKGVLLVPEDCVGDKDIREIADEWSRFDGVIAYKAKPGVPVPQQISANSTNIGIGDLLNLQLKFFEDISGVSGALQGKPGYSGMSAALYAQQTQNSATSLLDLLDSFSMFTIDAAYKDVKNMQQFYDTKRVFNIAGKSGAQVEYDPQKIRDVEFDLSIVESTSTPVYRQIANDFLMEIWRNGQISLQHLLQHGEFPFADELLQSLQSQQEQLEEGKTPDALSPELQAQVQAKANAANVDKAYQMMRAA